MTSSAAWWRGLSASDRYRFYTRLSFQAAVAVPILVIVLDTEPWAWAAIVLAGLAALLATEVQPDFAVWPRTVPRRVGLPVAIGLLAAVGTTAAVVARVGPASAEDDAVTLGVLTGFLAALSVLPFLPRPWIVLGVGSAVLGLAFGPSPVGVVRVALSTAVVGGFAMGITYLTWWGLRVVDDLERAKVVESRLQVADERLRFARDLHDVVGRGFSAVAVKSELAATLARAGHADRAAAEMDEVKTLAVESMEQMRGLVRGYRDIDLDGEVAGARSLLDAAGCRLHVEGDATGVPTRYHEVAAWVVREGITNIVKHSSAATATLALGASGMSLRNDAAHAPGAPSSGHRGLAERLEAVGATLRTWSEGDVFVLKVRWAGTGETA